LTNTAAPPWKPTPEQCVETVDDLDKAFRDLEWRLFRKSLFHSWDHERFVRARTGLLELAEICDADLSRVEPPQRNK